MWQEAGTGPGGSANATSIVDAIISRTTNKTIIFFIGFSPFKTFSFESLLVLFLVKSDPC
jgi:hypothetical protein